MTLTAAQSAQLEGFEIVINEMSAFLRPRLVKENGNENNLNSVMRVGRKRGSGEGVSHKSKPGETFRAAQPVRI